MADQVKWRTVAIAIGAILVLGTGGVFAANASGIFERPAPEPTALVQEETTPTPTATPTPTPTPTPIAEPVVEAAPVAEELPAEPSGPDLCPEGTTSNSSDGYNDLSCMPIECYDAQPIPNPAYPQCDYFYPPDYYR